MEPEWHLLSVDFFSWRDAAESGLLHSREYHSCASRKLDSSRSATERATQSNVTGLGDTHRVPHAKLKFSLSDFGKQHTHNCLLQVDCAMWSFCIGVTVHE
mmetsp:Transcript_2960/g.11311  ORF Transcript_2960/g.11311 Transcript_2960/m.11311 type:complete len:101 (+) Transcript_2960:143-445(+)